MGRWARDRRRGGGGATPAAVPELLQVIDVDGTHADFIFTAATTKIGAPPVGAIQIDDVDATATAQLNATTIRGTFPDSTTGLTFGLNDTSWLTPAGIPAATGLVE